MNRPATLGMVLANRIAKEVGSVWITRKKLRD